MKFFNLLFMAGITTTFSAMAASYVNPSWTLSSGGGSSIRIPHEYPNTFNPYYRSDSNLLNKVNELSDNTSFRLRDPLCVAGCIGEGVIKGGDYPFPLGPIIGGIKAGECIGGCGNIDTDPPSNDTPKEPTNYTPSNSTPGDDKPADDKPADDKPADDKPANDKPADNDGPSHNPYFDDRGMTVDPSLDPGLGEGEINDGGIPHMGGFRGGEYDGVPGMGGDRGIEGRGGVPAMGGIRGGEYDGVPGMGGDRAIEGRGGVPAMGGIRGGEYDGVPGMGGDRAIEGRGGVPAMGGIRGGEYDGVPGMGGDRGIEGRGGFPAMGEIRGLGDGRGGFPPMGRDRGMDGRGGFPAMGGIRGLVDARNDASNMEGISIIKSERPSAPLDVRIDTLNPSKITISTIPNYEELSYRVADAVDICNRGIIGAKISEALGATSCYSVSSSKLNSLTSLNLSNSNIEIIPGYAFRGLISLKTLDLSGNKINSLPKNAFSILASLESLDLRNNKINEIPNSAFVGLNSLKSIQFNNNPITTMDRILVGLNSAVKVEGVNVTPEIQE